MYDVMVNYTESYKWYSWGVSKQYIVFFFNFGLPKQHSYIYIYKYTIYTVVYLTNVNHNIIDPCWQENRLPVSRKPLPSAYANRKNEFSIFSQLAELIGRPQASRWGWLALNKQSRWIFSTPSIISSKPKTQAPYRGKCNYLSWTLHIKNQTTNSCYISMSRTTYRANGPCSI